MSRRDHQPLTTPEGWAFDAWLDAEMTGAPVDPDVRILADFAALVLRRARRREQATLFRAELHRRTGDPDLLALLGHACAEARNRVRDAEELTREPFSRLRRAQGDTT